MKASEICHKAGALVSGERNQQHGGIEEGFTLTALFWSGYLNVEVTADMVADMMELLKISRRQSGGFNIDNYVDGAGYAGIAGFLAALRQPRTAEEDPLGDFERSWTGGATARETEDDGTTAVRDLQTGTVVFRLEKCYDRQVSDDR